MSDNPSHLDPNNWAELRAHAHHLLDDILDYTERIRERPVWQPMTVEARSALTAPLPQSGQPLDEVHAQFMEYILPFATAIGSPAIPIPKTMPSRHDSS